MLRRLFRQKDEETVGNPIEEGDSNGGRGWIGVFWDGKSADFHRNPKEYPTLSL
jgi:hypothetical protein